MSNDNAYVARFAGKHVLVVEDEYFLADETRRKLQEFGAHVVGPIARVDDALSVITRQKIDAAILDVHLDGELVFPVAEKLEELQIPYVFATGYDPSIIPQRFDGYVLSAKPINLDAIARALFDPGSQNH